MQISARKPLSGTLTAPGDKSISHRAAIFAALAGGRTHISNFAPGDDAASTLHCLQLLGAAVDRSGDDISVCGQEGGLSEPDDVLDCGNSGTTMRLLSGVLAGQKMHAVLTGDESLLARPMGRITVPLGEMGADIRGRQNNSLAPLSVQPADLRPVQHRLKVASAQVKSALLIAGLYCGGPVSVREPAQSRDHTERMLQGFGARVKTEERVVTVEGHVDRLEWTSDCLRVPGDISSAAFIAAAALLVPGSDICIRDVGINRTRAGMLRMLQRMGARVQITNRRSWGGEPVADLRVVHGPLRSVQVDADELVCMIDEVPVLALLASRAEGVSRFESAAELRVKETDRLAAIVEELGALGARVRVCGDDLVVRGGGPDTSGVADARGDHRMAMTLLLAGLDGASVRVRRAVPSISVSYPQFARDLQSLGARVRVPPPTGWVGLLGHPVQHSLSAAMFAAAFAAEGLEGWSYRPFDVPPPDLSDAVSGLRVLGVRGFNVTAPHKQEAARLVDSLDETARRADAVNTVVAKEAKLVGYNTDIYGVSRSLRQAGFSAEESSVLILGAGGAARAAACALADGGASTLWLANRTLGRARSLAREIRKIDPNIKTGCSTLADIPTEEHFDLVVQSTILGMAPHEGECPLASGFCLRPDMTVFEMVYNPPETPFLRRARGAGAQVIAGSEMLVHQGARAFELWTGLPAPVQTMRRRVRRELTCLST